MNNILEEVRLRTKEDLMTKLSQYGRCALTRCTGFGKTWLISEVSQDYKSVLYLYPAEIIRQTAIYAIEENTSDIDEDRYTEELKAEFDDEIGYDFDYRNIKFMTYAKLAKLTRDEIKNLPDYDLIIMDEVHRAGAPLTKRNILWIMYYKQESLIIGATATPERMDAFDVIAEFFNGICVYPYTLHDAVSDGIVKMPYYVYCTFDIETSFKQAARLTGQDINNPTVTEVINSRLMEVSNIYNMPDIIHKTIEKYVADKDFMKFIVFFSSINQLDSCIDDVKGWFASAYPEYTIKVLVVCSESKKTRDNLNKLNFERTNKTIVLIACIDMLNMGYHVNDLTGIVMYRCTQSSTIFIQQLGRALSTGSKNACVVFDTVDNLHRKSLFNLTPPYASRRPHTTLTKKERVQRLLSDVDTDLSVQERELLTKFIEDKLEAEDEIAFNAIWAKINEITKEDIRAVDHLATYREIIAKTVAEVKHVRAKRAAEEYFRIQSSKCNRSIPTTIAEVKRMKDIPPELAIFANWQKIEENDILEYLDPDHTGKVDVDKIKKGIKEAMTYC